MILTSVLQAIGLYAATNIDDIIVLSLFFARGAGQRGTTARILAGQYLGFAGILGAAVLVTTGAGAFLPSAAIPYFGLIPLGLGLWAAWQAWRGDDDDDDDGEEEAERRVRESQLEAECREIETLIKRKQHDTESTMNTLIKSRHQQALRKLQVEHESKKRLLGDLKHIRRTRREERAAHARSQQDAHAEASTDPSPTEAS